MTIAIDTETSLVSNAEPVPRLVSAAVAWGESEEATDLLHHTEAYDTLKDVLQSCTPEDPIVLANAPFDGTVISERYPDLERLWWSALRAGAVADVLTRERLLDVAEGLGLRRPYNLGAVAERRAGIKVDKADPWRKRYVELIDTPIVDWPVEARSYAINDATANIAVHNRQIAVRIDGLDPLEDAARQARAHWALKLSSLWGVTPDPEAVAKLDARLLADRETLKEALQEDKLVREDGSADLKAVQAMAKEAGVTRETKRGVGTAKDDFDQLGLGPEHPLQRLVRYSGLGRERTKMRNAFMRPVLRPWYTELLETGRVSARDPNTTNFPRKGGYRECLVPRPGNIFVAADWSTAELRAWAHLQIVMFGEDAPSAAMAQAFREGRDVHAELAMSMGTERGAAKGPNFGRLGGMGTERLQDYLRKQWDHVIDLKTAAKYKAGFDRQWRPHAYFAWISEQQDESGYAAIKQYKSNRLRGGCTFSEAANTLFQGLVADIAKETLWRLACRMYILPENPMYGARQALFVHDENVIECPVEQAEDVAVELEAVMKQTFEEWCPTVPCEVDVKLLERYTK